jgi:hypothetical protein
LPVPLDSNSKEALGVLGTVKLTAAFETGWPTASCGACQCHQHHSYSGDDPQERRVAGTDRNDSVNGTLDGQAHRRHPEHSARSSSSVNAIVVSDLRVRLP